MTMGPRGIARLVAAFFLALVLATGADAAQYRPKQVHVEYAQPKNPMHEPIYRQLKQLRALEPRER